MALIELTDDSFEAVYTKPENEILLLDFWAPWCGPCHQFAPIFEQVAGEYPQYIFGKVNTESEARLSGYFGIRSIPTLIIIREQMVVHEQAGVVGAETLRQLIGRTEALDTEELRRQEEAD